ncbi:MAG: hypothetical protein AAF653_04805 [Chloroflexota bacterium]
MPVEISWLVTGRISYFRYSGVVTLDEIEQASQRGIEMLGESDAVLVHSIQDGRKVTEFPKNLKAMLDVSGKAMQHAKMGWMVNLTDQNPFLVYIASMIGKLTQTRQRFLPDVKAALTFLADVDTTLPDLTDRHVPYDKISE